MKIYNQDAIRTIRKKHKLSLEAFANSLPGNVSRQLVSQWERGAQIPSFTSILKIVNRYKVSLNAFIMDNRVLAEKTMPLGSTQSDDHAKGQ